MSGYSLRFFTVAAVFLAAALLLSSLQLAGSGEAQPAKDSALKELAEGIRYVVKIRPITSKFPLSQLWVHVLPQ